MTRKVSELLSGRGNVARNCGAASRHPFHLEVLLAHGHTTHGDATHLPRLAAAPARHQQRLVGLVAKDAHWHPMRHPLWAGGQWEKQSSFSGRITRPSSRSTASAKRATASKTTAGGPHA